MRNSISSGGIVGGSRFLTADRERELRDSIERRNSEVSVVEEPLEQQEGLEREQEEAEVFRYHREEWADEGGNGEGDGERSRIVTTGEMNEFDMGQKMTEISDRIRTGVRNILTR